MTGSGLVVIGNDELTVVVDAADGARLTSVRFAGMEFLRQSPTKDSGLHYGSYPMAPFAGRIAFGQLAFKGVTYNLPQRMAPHAIHGTVLDRQWTYQGQSQDAHAFSISGDERWPFPFELRQCISVNQSSLTLELELSSDVEQPAWMGWHPWWLRQLDRGGSVELTIPARAMMERIDMIPSGRRVSPTAGPWDDTFTDLTGPVVLTWPGAAQVSMSSSHQWWVVYTEETDAVCAEPQSAPPHAAALGLATLVGPRNALRMSTTWEFARF